MFWKRKRSSAKSPPRSDVDPEIEALRAQVAKRQEQVAALELDFFDFNRFAAELEERLGPLQRRLEDLETQLDEARQRVARRARWGARADAGDVPEARDLFEEYRRAAKHAPPPPPPAPEPPDDAREASIKTLFRALAKRFHPDLTTDQEEKHRRVETMAQVNEAYAARDLSALEALARQPDRPEVPTPKTREEIMAELRAEVERLDGVIADLEQRLDQLAGTQAVQLKLEASLARRMGRDLLAELENELLAQIARLEAELAAIGQ
jgi:predicted  nucleic acid-binding Zn-ribbon protein